MISILIYLFIFTVDALADDLLAESSVTCKSDTMEVALKFNKAFSGSIFTEKGFEKLDCKWKGTGQREMTVAIPLSEAAQCGVAIREDVGEMSVKLIATPIAGIIVDGFAALSVQCQYTTQDITLTLPVGHPLHITGTNVDASVITGKGGAPVLTMQILDGHGITGKPLARASVGQRITLDALLKDTSIYDFLLHSCHAHDGSNSPDASISVIDENGCGIRLSRAIDIPAMISEPVQGGPKHVFLHMYGFQFTSSHFVHFECQARPCVHTCKQQQCSALPTPFPGVRKRNRRRRQNGIDEIDHRLDTLRLLTVLQIEPQQSQPAALVSSTYAEATCVSQNTLLLTIFTIVSIIAASACLMCLFLRRTSHSVSQEEPAYSIASLYR